jgi:hypothetical protein
METRDVIRSQYLAALEMLKQAVERCPETLWDVAAEQNKFWQIAYHALFFTHLYLQETIQDFRPWPKHREGSETPGAAAGNGGTPYTREEVLEYLGVCQDQVAERTASLDIEAPSGFEWLPFGKLELQFYSIRHIQQHVGELFERLGARAAIQLDWVGRGPE